MKLLFETDGFRLLVCERSQHTFILLNKIRFLFVREFLITGKLQLLWGSSWKTVELISFRCLSFPEITVLLSLRYIRIPIYSALRYLINNMRSMSKWKLLGFTDNESSTAVATNMQVIQFQLLLLQSRLLPHAIDNG